MNQTININQKNIQHYLKDIKKQLLLTHPKEETASIIEMLQTSINEFIEDNPTATMEDLTMHFSDSRTIKKIAFFVLLLVVLAFIIYAILCVKTYIDIQNSIDAYKVIEIN